ncbi:Mu transposase C-terminal domain-containing protein [Litoribacter populi]|uniref:Mu transposase C-terminal domain-containing protein n=1 Tax=Litoribacter populi TaxID=2598460 RepID=UPI00117E1306|nr:Mu transposase C-terminal domain-containing protein [Litoribacter populi]
MEYHFSKLCLEYDELVPSVFNRDNFYYHKDKGNITVHGIGGNGRKVLIEFESLPIKYRRMVRELYGDPYVYASRQPILNSLEWDFKAQRFYTDYILPNGDKLPATDKDLKGKPQINYVHRYTEAATWLNMLGRLTQDKKALKRELNISVMEFWQQASEMIKLKNVKLPADKEGKRLKTALKKYQEGGYEQLINLHKFGNSYTKKVDEDFLKALLKQRNRHDDTVIADAYNDWARENGKDDITPGTVGYWRKKWKNYLLLFQEGEGKVRAKIKKKISRERASAPLLFINSDDNVWDVYFYKPETTIVRNGKTRVIPENKWFKLTLYVVYDTYNDMPLGYAAGHTVTIQLIKDAYRDAARYVKKMTGNQYMWQQIQTDRWALDNKQENELGQFYKSMAKSTPAELKNPYSKYVEGSFGTTWHQVLKKMFPKNYAGHNIKAKENLNPDTLSTKNFPHIEEAPYLLASFIQALRNTKRKGCDMTREQEWLTALMASKKSQERIFNEEMYLSTFGVKHIEKNTITDKGIVPTLMGQKRQYELSQGQILQHIGKKMQVIYDPSDLSKVLVTDGKTTRFVAEEFRRTPAALADYEEGDAARIRALQQEGNTLIPFIREWAGDVEGRLLADAEARLQAGVMTKSVTHLDQKLVTAMGNGAGKLTQPNEDDEDEFNAWDLV